MDSLSDVSCAMYRDYVREQPDFVPYFRAATPELELGKLPLGSRPAKRRPTEEWKHYVLFRGFCMDTKPLNVTCVVRGWCSAQTCD